MSHAYDFYKPNLASQYPVVDGKLSINCYLKAVEKCYHGYLKKAKHALCKQINFQSETDKTYPNSMDDIDYMVFHSPVCKLTQKSFARLVFLDFLRKQSKLIDSDKKYEEFKEFRYEYIVSVSIISCSYLKHAVVGLYSAALVFSLVHS